MSLLAFTNSVGFHSFNKEGIHEGQSYTDMLPLTDKFCKDGLTIINAVKYLPRMITGTEQTLIINIGVVECMSYSNINISHWAASYAGQWGVGHLYKTFIFPKLHYASHDVAHNLKTYYQALTIDEFVYIWTNFLSRVIQGCTVIVIGTGCPREKQPHWMQQLQELNNALSALSDKFNYKFIPVWDLLMDHMADGTHFTAEGHQLVFEEIQRRL